MKLISLIIAGAGILIMRVTLFMLTVVSFDEENSGDEDNNNNNVDNNNEDNNEDNNNNNEDNNEHSVPLKKGPWTAEEDEILAAYVTAHGIGNWNIVRKNTGLARCGKSCRLRWTNHLRPDLRRGPFSEQEQRKVIELHAQWGNKWAKMAQELPGRTDNEIKNFWNTRLKKLRRTGSPIYPDDINPALKIEIPESSVNASGRRANDSQDAGTSSSVPELVLHNYNQNHPLLEQPTDQLAGINTFLDGNCVYNTAPTATDHESGEIYHFFLPDSLFMSEYPLTTNIPPYNSIDTSGMYAFPSDPSSMPWLPPFPSIDDNTLATYNSIDTSGMYVSPSVPSSIPGLLPFPSTDDNTLTTSMPPYRFINTSEMYAHPSVPSSIPELPPFPSNGDNNIVIDDELTLESLFYENASPRTNGDLETILLPPEVLEGSNHCPVKGESSNPGNGENLEVRHHANQEALGNFSCRENYDNNQNALEDLEAYLQKDNRQDEIGDW